MRAEMGKTIYIELIFNQTVKSDSNMKAKDPVDLWLSYILRPSYILDLSYISQAFEYPSYRNNPVAECSPIYAVLFRLNRR